MAEPADKPSIGDVMTLVHQQRQMIQDLIAQQADTEETSSYRIRDLQKQIISLRKLRADDADQHKDEIESLRKQLDQANLQNANLESRVAQLNKTVRSSATDAAMEALSQFNVTTDSKLNSRVNKLEEKNARVQEDVNNMKRDTLAQLDQVDIQVESLGNSMRQVREEVQDINADSLANAVAEPDLKRHSVTKLRGRLDEFEGQLKNLAKTSASTTKGVERLQGDVDRCKTTFYFFNEATKPHVERKGHESGGKR